MKVVYREAALQDLTRLIRYYLVDQDVPLVAIRFRKSFSTTVNRIRIRPAIAPPCLIRGAAKAGDLRSWPLDGFRSTRVYFLLSEGQLEIVRILHGKRNVRRILGQELSRG